MPAHGISAFAGHQQGHEGKRGDFDQVGGAHGNAELEQGAEHFQVRWSEFQVEGLVKGAAPDQQQADQRAQPHHDDARHGRARGAVGGKAQIAVNKDPIEEGLQADAGQVDQHHHFRPRNGRVQRINGPEQQTGGQGQDLQTQIGGDLLPHLGRDVAGEAEPDVREQEDEAARHAQHQGKPHALRPSMADPGVLFGAELLGDERNQGMDHPGQADEHTDENGRGQRHRRQGGRIGMAGHGRIKNAIGHAGPLAKQDGPGLLENGPDGGEGLRRPGESWHGQLASGR